jgi:DNA-binding NarL/FixJ family response regulator
MTTMTIDSASYRPAPRSASLARLVGVIGADGFGPAFAQYLYELCGADHFAAFHFASDDLRQIAACCVDPTRTASDRVESYVQQGWWRRDPAMAQAQQHLLSSQPGIIHVDFSDSGYIDMRSRVYPHVRDRLLMCGRSDNASFGLSVLKADPHAPFSPAAIGQLGESADVLMAMLAKHISVRKSRPNVAEALTLLVEIEGCIEATQALPRREMEVCARILYGLSSTGIALDLGVSEETVKTYRKRAYQRLEIGSERELLTWYLARWSHWRGHCFDLAAARALH